MITIGFPTILKTERFYDSIGETNTALQKAMEESVTGYASDYSDHLRGNVGQLQLLFKQQNDLQRYQNALVTLQTEYEYVEEVLGTTHANAAALSVEIDAALAIEDNVSIGTIAIEAENELRALFGRINTAYGGKNLFSGAATDTTPLGSVDDLLTDITGVLNGSVSKNVAENKLDEYFDAASTATSGVFLTDIYRGSTTAAPTLEISEGRRLSVDISALDQSVLDMIKSLSTIAVQARRTPDAHLRDDFLDLGAEDLREAADGVITKRAEVGADLADVQRLLASNEATSFALQLRVNELVGVDQFEAATQLSEIETRLEAIYLTTARIQNLSLVNFL